MITTLMPLPKQQYFAIAGVPLVGGKVYTYDAGTTRPKDTYTNPDGSEKHQNPIRLNSRGEPPSAIYWSGNYRVEIRDALGNLIYTVNDYNTDPAKISEIFPNLAKPTGGSLIGHQPDGNDAEATNMSDQFNLNVDLRNFPAQSDVGGNQSRYFLDALAEVVKKKLGTLYIPRGNWRLVDEITLSDRVGINGEQQVASSLILEGDGNYGIRVAGAGLGGSATDGIDIGNLNLQGGKGIALLAVQGSAMFKVHDITAQNNTKGNVFRLTQCQDAVFSHVDILQCGGVAPAAPDDGAQVYVGPASNNIYFYYLRIEAPRNTAIFVDGGDTIRVLGGKVDGSFGGAELTSNPFVVCRNGSISLREYTITGFKSYPFNVTGYGTIDFAGSVGNGLAPAVFNNTTPVYNRFIAQGGLPGVIMKPFIKFRGSVGFSSANTASNIIGAVISLLAPVPVFRPDANSNGFVQITGAFDTGGGLFQASIAEWNGSAYVAPSANDRYTGMWLVDQATGNPFAQITTQAGGLVQFRTNGLTSTGNTHFIQFDNVHGVRVDIQIEAPAFPASRWKTRLTELKAAVTVTSASYAAGFTTVQLSATVPNDTLIGCFLWDKTADAYYYVSGNSGSQLTVMHDRTAAISANQAATGATPRGFEVVIGNPKAGAGIAISWV